MLRLVSRRCLTRFSSTTPLKLKLVRYQATNSGVLGTNRFVQIPRSQDTSTAPASPTTALSITDPYIVYKHLVQTKEIEPDPHQLASIKKLRALSEKLQSYKPNLTSVRINRLVRELEIRYNQQQQDAKGVLFGYTIGWFRERENKKLRTELVKVLNDYEELSSDEMKEIPRGILINGEVGCGKTMLMDIFADSLPIQGKWRIHWGVFIQWVMKEIESISSRKRDRFMQANHPLLNYENEFVLFEVAARMIEKCHVLILDEFMLPDIASAKIINVLFVYYFKLGGVLVASSNRLPEELYSGSINKSTMGSFEQILRARCDVWDMQSEIDYRTNLKEDDIAEEKWLVLNTDPNYNDTWNKLVSKFIDLESCENNAVTFTSYGRDIVIPKTSNGVAYFDFNDVVRDSSYGPGDFISIATKYPTIIIDNVPILSIKMKNHARRLITFIDAIYDSRCNLVIKLETDPVHLFFPDIRDNSPTRFKCTPLEDGPNPVCMSEAGHGKSLYGYDSVTTTEDVQNLEMFAKTEMDISNPYRPNFATYEDDNKAYNIEQGEEDMKKNFTDMKKFTGEDKMFAYKRAVSRIKEMTHSKRWRNSRWIPLHDSIKPWERVKGEADGNLEEPQLDSVRLFESEVSEPAKQAEVMQKSGTATQRKDAPEFKEYNFWSMGKWKSKKDKLHDEIAKRWVQGAGDVKK